MPAYEDVRHTGAANAASVACSLSAGDAGAEAVGAGDAAGSVEHTGYGRFAERESCYDSPVDAV